MTNTQIQKNSERKIESKKELNTLTNLINELLPMEIEDIGDFDGLIEEKPLTGKYSKPNINLPDNAKSNIFWDLIETILNQLSPLESDYKIKFLNLITNKLNDSQFEQELDNFDECLANLSNNPRIEMTLKETNFNEYFSDDGLQYLGYYLVSRGAIFYKNVLTSPKKMEKELNLISNNKLDMDAIEFEELAYVVASLKEGRMKPHNL